MRAVSWVLILGLLAGACGGLQKPVNFVATNKLDGAVESVSQTLLAAGYATKKIGRQSNVVQTSWQDTHVQSGQLKEKLATVVRRFTVTVEPVAKGVNVTVRVDMKRCQEGAVKVSERAEADTDETDAADADTSEAAKDDKSKHNDDDSAGAKAKSKGKSHKHDDDDDDDGDENAGKHADKHSPKSKHGAKASGDEAETDEAADASADDAKDAKDAKDASKASAPPVETTLHGVCEDLTVMPSGFQEELEALAQKLEKALHEAHEPAANSDSDSDGDGDSNGDE